MIYKELLAHLQTLTPAQLNMDVTIYDQSSDEYYAAGNYQISIGGDVLDDHHPYIDLER